MTAKTSPPRLRSVLYVPADNARALGGAGRRSADVLLIDLEDPVAPHAKVPAREAACEAARVLHAAGHRVVVRCNHPDTIWGPDDLAALASLPIEGVCVPKVAGVAEVDRVIGLLGGAPLPVWPMIELPSAVLDARAIAGHVRVPVLVMGTNDLAFALRVDDRVEGRATLLPYLAQVILAARAEGVRVLDGASTVIDDPEGFRAECRQARAMGFDGKTVIHPAQVGIANEEWTPTAAQCEEARRVIAAWEVAEAEGRGVAVLDGRMIETMHVARAREVLALGDPIR